MRNIYNNCFRVCVTRNFSDYYNTFVWISIVVICWLFDDVYKRKSPLRNYKKNPDVLAKNIKWQTLKESYNEFSLVLFYKAKKIVELNIYFFTKTFIRCPLKIETDDERKVHHFIQREFFSIWIFFYVL